MSAMTLTKTHLVAGVWEGELVGAGDLEPRLTVTHQNTPIKGLSLERHQEGKSWIVKVRIPVELIADGVQTFVISEPNSQTTLASFSLLSGEALAEDIRAEINLLRAELDMLKRSFRRHVSETQG